MLREVTSAMFSQSWGDDDLVISKLWNKFLFQSKAQVTEASHSGCVAGKLWAQLGSYLESS